MLAYIKQAISNGVIYIDFEKFNLNSMCSLKSVHCSAMFSIGNFRGHWIWSFEGCLIEAPTWSKVLALPQLHWILICREMMTCMWNWARRRRRHAALVGWSVFRVATHSCGSDPRYTSAEDIRRRYTARRRQDTQSLLILQSTAPAWIRWRALHACTVVLDVGVSMHDRCDDASWVAQTGAYCATTTTLQSDDACALTQRVRDITATRQRERETRSLYSVARPLAARDRDVQIDAATRKCVRSLTTMRASCDCYNTGSDVALQR